MNYIPSYSSTTPQPEATTAGNPTRILIVEDDPLLCGLYSLVLERERYDIVTAENGADALTQLSAGGFDLVITDRAMPVLDGAEMIMALRSAGSRIPVIMISGSLETSPLPAAIVREVSIALLKPARPVEILSAVAHVLKAHSTSERQRVVFDEPAPSMRG
jgi:CheY-like chemotaxis protein